jgi:hypothetical protein|tara:strand:- start:2075 stop:2281 length:207 start_codon:yes stop_codon:yes gene_type:complete
MLSLPEWEISREGKITTIHFSLAGIKVCDISSDKYDNKTATFHTSTIDFDMLEVIIQIASDKIGGDIP